MDCDLPGVYYRPDRGWSPQVRGLVGAQMHGDAAMATLIVNGMTVNEMRDVVVNIAGLCANLLALGPWGDGCVSEEDVIERWNVATARLVAELSGYETPEGDGDDG